MIKEGPPTSLKTTLERFSSTTCQG